MTSRSPHEDRTVVAVDPAVAPAAVLCDLDGTMLDTEQAWRRTVIASIEAFGCVASDRVVSATEGATLEQTAALLVENFGLLGSADDVLRELETRTLARLNLGPDWLPGARGFLESLSARGVPIGLVTSSPRRWVDEIARHRNLSVFRVVITADDVARTKPHPEPYLRAAASFGIAPAQCVVFEDSRPGLSAALAAGCRTVLVRSDTAGWAEDADATVPSLTVVSSDWLTDRFGPWSAAMPSLRGRSTPFSAPPAGADADTEFSLPADAAHGDRNRARAADEALRSPNVHARSA